MSNEEIQLFDEIVTVAGVKETPVERERTRAGSFLNSVMELLTKISKGKATQILTTFFPIIYAKVDNIEKLLADILPLLKNLKK